MRFEVFAAFAFGILVPLLETVRRGIHYWTIDFSTMFEDYVAGVLLLTGAWAAHSQRSWGDHFLLLAWASFTGLMSSSFWYQLELTIRQTVSEPHSSVVLAVKFLLWLVCITSLVLAFRRALNSRNP